MWGDPLGKDYKDWDDVFAKHPSTYNQTKWIEKYGKVPGKDGVSMFDL